MPFLSELLPGERAHVESIDRELAGSPPTRLTEMGLIAGTRLECVAKAPFGDTKAYLIRGAVIALRRSDARSIHVRRIPKGSDCPDYSTDKISDDHPQSSPKNEPLEREVKSSG